MSFPPFPPRPPPEERGLSLPGGHLPLPGPDAFPLSFPGGQLLFPKFGGQRLSFPGGHLFFPFPEPLSLQGGQFLPVSLFPLTIRFTNTVSDALNRKIAMSLRLADSLAFSVATAFNAALISALTLISTTGLKAASNSADSFATASSLITGTIVTRRICPVSRFSSRLIFSIWGVTRSFKRAIGCTRMRPSLSTRLWILSRYLSTDLNTCSVLATPLALIIISICSPAIPSPSFLRRHRSLRFPLELHAGHQEQLLAARKVPELSGAQVVANPQRMNHAGERPGSD